MNVMPFGNSPLMTIVTPLAYKPYALKSPWTSHRPLAGNVALPQTSTGPVNSVPMPQWAEFT